VQQINYRNVILYLFMVVRPLKFAIGHHTSLLTHLREQRHLKQETRKIMHEDYALDWSQSKVFLVAVYVL